MPSINQKNFWICHCGEGALCFRFDLAKVFLQGAPCHPNTQIFLLEFSLLWKGGIMLLLRLSQGISSGCHHVTPTPQFFWNCHYCGKGALCFRFDLAKLFLQGPTMPTLHQKFSFVIVIVGRGIILLLRFSQGISSGCHLATPTPKFFFRNCCYYGKGTLCFCFDLAKAFLQGATMPPLHPFFLIVIIVGRGHYTSAST